MALQKKTVTDVIYSCERLENDAAFAEKFKNLPKEKKEVIVSESSYSVVEGIEGNKNQLSFTLTTYVDNNKECVISRSNYKFIPDVSTNNTPNFYTQAYEYLKTLPEFENAIDC